MKKFVVLLVVVAMTLVAGVAFAEVTVGGEVSIRSRNLDNLDLNDNLADDAKAGQRDTQTRFKFDVNAKVGDVRGKLQLWNDWETWDEFRAQAGSVTSAATTTNPPVSYNNNTIGIREAWVSFNVPGLPVNVTGGHQLLTLGNGWFFRSMHYGSNAWVVATKIGDNVFGIADVKVSEGNVQSSDDIDAYALFGAIKLNEDMAIGFDVSDVKDRRGHAFLNPADLYNIGAHFNGKVGPVALKAALDFQAGSIDTGAGDVDFSGNQIVIQGSVPLAPVTVNFTVARGSGDDGTTADENEGMVTFLDVDPHYTFIYEYKRAAITGEKNTGFENTTALGAGASFAATKSLTVGADIWLLKATETAAGASDDIGQEIDVKVNWKVADNLSWNWVAGVFMPGDAMAVDGDDATGIQGALIYKF